MKLTRKVRVLCPFGLHTRPATALVKMLRGVKSRVTLTHKNETVDGKSLLGILMLAAKKNTVITVDVEGEDAERAMEMIVQAFLSKFEEATT